MKKLLLSVFTLLSLAMPSYGAIVINEKSYDADTLIRKEIGPGVIYTRIRIPSYPLNINTITMDLTNPYNKVETTQGAEALGNTEGLENAYKRQNTVGHRPLAAANANFWCTTEKPYSDYMKGTPFGGSLRNGKIITETNMASDTWDGGADRTGIVSIDNNKKLWIESMTWTGTVASSKWTSTQDIAQVNKMCNDGELVMFNSYYGKTRAFNTTNANTEVFLTLKEGSDWAVNKDMVAVVKEIKPNSGANTLGDYDLCLSGNGGYKTELEKLAVGDEITLHYSWKSIATNDEPELAQLVAGNAIVLKDGELTGRNNDETYNSQVYSRTGYGMSKDGKTLFVVVIDKSTDSTYGLSAGCSTGVMSQIMKQAGCWNLCTMDAGGSAQMLIQGKIINKTTEGTPRAVANGWMLYSVAEPETQIARLEFADYKLLAPIYSSFVPVIYGYDKYGNLIDENVQNVVLTCDSNVGSTNGNTFIAGSKAALGTITATVNGITVTKDIEVKNAELSIRINPIIIDKRKYPMEVIATINGNVYNYNPASLTWAVADPTIAKIDENGALQGLANGTTTVSCSLGDFNGSTVVNVEIPDGEKMNQSFDGWTLKASGASNLALSNDGVLSLNYTGGRAPYIQMTKEYALYSLPKSFGIKFTSTMPLSYIAVDIRTATTTSQNIVYLGKTDGGFEANKTYDAIIPTSELGNADDLIIYPITLKYISFYPVSASATTGTNNITFDAIYTTYDTSGSVGEVISKKSDIKIYPNPIKDGIMNIVANGDEANVAIFDTTGKFINSSKVALNGNVGTMNVSNLEAGLYFVKIGTAESKTVEKIIIK